MHLKCCMHTFILKLYIFSLLTNHTVDGLKLLYGPAVGNTWRYFPISSHRCCIRYSCSCSGVRYSCNCSGVRCACSCRGVSYACSCSGVSCACSCSRVRYDATTEACVMHATAAACVMHPAAASACQASQRSCNLQSHSRRRTAQMWIFPQNTSRNSRREQHTCEWSQNTSRNSRREQHTWECSRRTRVGTVDEKCQITANMSVDIGIVFAKIRNVQN